LPGSFAVTAREPDQLVRFEPVRSAEPPMSSGRRGPIASIACCDALRVATVSRFSVARASIAFTTRPPSPVSSPASGAGIRAAPRECLLVGGEALAATRARAPGPWRARPTRVDVLGNLEGRVLPADRLARRGDFLLAQRRAVARVRCPALSGEPLPITVFRHMSVGLCARQRACLDRRGDGARIVAVDAGDHVPAVGREALGVSSRNQPSTSPSMEIRCRRRADELAEPSVPASEHASWEMPSIRQPSPTKT
jgi:hypothetical protein